MNEGAPQREGGEAELDAAPVVRPVRRVGEKSFLQLFPQLFLIPLLLVTVGVLVYLFFIAVAEDTRSVEQILRDMESGGDHSRTQDAFALSRLVMERNAPGEPVDYFSDEATSLLITILREHPDDEFMRVYLVKTLGWAGPPARSVPELERLLEREEAPRVEQIAVLQALGFTRSPAALVPLLGFAGDLDEVSDWELRLVTVTALVQIAKAREDIDRAAVAAVLRQRLGDSQREVSWNTAYYLAAYFDDPSAAAILRQILDIEYLERQRGERQRPLTSNEKQAWLVQALRGLRALDPAEVEPRLDALRELARENRWYDLLGEIESLDAGAAGDGDDPEAGPAKKES